MPEALSLAALWWAVLASGLYHGLNPGMGWPLAVSAALMERRRAALPLALAALGAGHFLAMVLILVPFAVMTLLIDWQREIRLGAAGLVIAMGLWLLANDRHPRFLARVPPHRLALWSFLVAIAHGAGLMLVPIYLGICAALTPGSGEAAAADLMTAGLGQAVLVSAAHTAAMVVAGGVLAVGVYFWLGLRFLSAGWFNLDRVWALSLIAVGAIAGGAAL
jgi:hypothetical protein